jgi:hypothetical protein
MKKLRTLLLILILFGFSLFMAACNNDDENGLPPENTKLYRTEMISEIPEVIEDELELGFNFFWELANTDKESNAYGLIPDRYDTKANRGGNVSSIASVGFGLSAIPMGIEAGYITREEGEDRAYHTLLTFKDDLERIHGFWFHFLSMTTGERVWESELSIIDSALFINGALVVGRYFGGRTEQLAYELYEDMEWNWYFDHNANKFYMGYWPERNPQHQGYWNGYAEQLMLFILAAGSPEYSVHKGAYQLMKFNSTLVASTNDYGAFYPTWTGSIFTHQYSHAWFDFAKYNDQDGYNWFTNSVNAVDAAIAYAKTQTAQHEGINENSWGMSASDGPGDTPTSGDVYRGNYGSGPAQGSNSFIVDGTVPAYGAIGSIVFRPEQAIAAAENYRTFSSFWSVYGFKGAYNLSKFSTPWFAKDIIGIDKGISILMIENYISGMIWDIYMEVPYIQDAITELGFTPVA